jgi:hypothetical protein
MLLCSSGHAVKSVPLRFADASYEQKHEDCERHEVTLQKQ